ncbi:MAG TPA: 1,4-dihydroxy-2-naphthoate octaprenyltransferase [Ktedonobacteraceae bacterium]|nr:1,4-dihydroxy-2-naphthoate octaprenyltransferase [Ktedonobacteraceae bacterium]
MSEITPHTDTSTPPAWKVWIKTGRPFTLTATLSPLLVGTAVAAYEGIFRPLNFLLALLAGLLLQIGTNYFNEYFDYRYGLDSLDSLGASTVIFRGEMTARQVFGGGLTCFLLAILLSFVLIYLVGPAIILFGLVGMAIAYFYSARPFTLARRGLGDIMVYLAMGLLMTWGAYYVQIQHWSWLVFVASVPVGFLVTAILNMNNVRDYQEDRLVHKLTLPVRFGQTFGVWYHTCLLLGSYLAVVVFVVLRWLPAYSLIVWITFPLAFLNVRSVLTAIDRKAFIMGIKRTSMLHLQFGVMLAVGLLLARL